MLFSGRHTPVGTPHDCCMAGSAASQQTAESEHECICFDTHHHEGKLHTGQCLHWSMPPGVRCPCHYKGESAQQPQSSPEGRWWRMIITSSSAGLPGAEAAGGDHIQLARSLYNRPCAIRELADSVFTTENSHLSETSVSKQQLVVCPKHVRYYIRCVSRPPMGHSHRDKAMLFGQLCVNKRRNTRGLMTTR